MNAKLILGILIFLFYFGNTTLNAQQEVTWDTYGLQFTLPQNLSITANTGYEFSAESEDVYLYITPWKSDDVELSDLAEGLETAADDFDFDEVTSISKAEISDYTGWAIYGTKDGFSTIMWFLLDELSSTNIAMTVVYNDGYERVVQSIYKSIHAYDP